MSQLNLNRIKDIPPSDRPRERLGELGTKSLSDAELLALVLGSGMRGRNALTWAGSLLAETGGLSELARVDFDALKNEKGLGSARASRVAAALELGRRCAVASRPDRSPIRTPADAAQLVSPHLLDLTQEHVVVILLDARRGVLRTTEVHRGSQTAAPVCIKSILRLAISATASGIIVAHNHPSGDPSPSLADERCTASLVSAAMSVGVDVIDHLIITRSGFCSLLGRDRGFDVPPRVRRRSAR